MNGAIETHESDPNPPLHIHMAYDLGFNMQSSHPVTSYSDFRIQP